MIIPPLIAELAVRSTSRLQAVAVCEHRASLPGVQGYSARNEWLDNVLIVLVYYETSLL